MKVDYDALAEARAEYEESLACEHRIALLRERMIGHRRMAISLYKAAGIGNTDIRRIMLLGTVNDD